MALVRPENLGFKQDILLYENEIFFEYFEAFRTTIFVIFEK